MPSLSSATEPQAADPAFDSLLIDIASNIFEALPNFTPLILAASFALVLYTYRNSVLEVSPAEKLKNFTHYFADTYANRTFTAVKVDAGDGKYDEVSSVVGIRRWVTANYQRGDSVLTGIQEASGSTKRGLVEFRQKSLTLGTPENQFAYELTLGMQQAGHMVAAGGLPFWSIFGTHGEAIIEDWVTCSRLVDRIRFNTGEYLGTDLDSLFGEGETKPAQTPRVISRPRDFRPFRRRYGEWMTLVAVLYVWSRCGLVDSIMDFREYCCDDKTTDENFEAKIIERAEEIMNGDKHIVARSVRKAFKTIKKMKRIPFVRAA